MKIVFSGKCLKYDAPGHPESSERVRRVYEFLKNKRFKNRFQFVEPDPCSRQDLLAVHSEKMIDTIKHGKFMNFETPALPNIYGYAKLSAGAAIIAMKIALEEGKSFSLMRPPGHHASQDKFEGFCYFNNIAIAVTKALKHVKRVAILDIDVHHGNGTQDIFMGHENVLFVSLHQYGFFYPGTGKHSEENCINYPLEAGTEESEYLGKLEAAVERIKEYGPNLLAISAGFDTYREDPIGGIKLGPESYSKIADIINEIRKPKFAVLEGGYSDGMKQCVFEFLKGF